MVPKVYPLSSPRVWSVLGSLPSFHICGGIISNGIVGKFTAEHLKKAPFGRREEISPLFTRKGGRMIEALKRRGSMLVNSSSMKRKRSFETDQCRRR